MRVRKGRENWRLTIPSWWTFLILELRNLVRKTLPKGKKSTPTRGGVKRGRKKRRIGYTSQALSRPHVSERLSEAKTYLGWGGKTGSPLARDRYRRGRQVRTDKVRFRLIAFRPSKEREASAASRDRHRKSVPDLERRERLVPAYFCRRKGLGQTGVLWRLQDLDGKGQVTLRYQTRFLRRIQDCFSRIFGIRNKPNVIDEKLYNPVMHVY